MKLIKTVILLSSISICYAQSNKGINYTTINTPDGNSQTIIGVAPGIAIQTPWWINNLSKPVKNEEKTEEKTDLSTKISKIPEEKLMDKKVDNIKNDNIQNVQKNLKEVTAKENENIQNVANIKKTETVKKDVEVKRNGQINTHVKIVNTNDVGVWNQSTLLEMEAIGERNAQEAYLNPK